MIDFTGFLTMVYLRIGGQQRPFTLKGRLTG